MEIVSERTKGRNREHSLQKMILKVIVVVTWRLFINVQRQEDKVCLCKSTACRRKHIACLRRFVENLSWNSIFLSTSNSKDV